ncbi:hypothetical protein G7Y79_00011g031020 [Physcia stellaris]|nr:hypothetical protein G7Y79_00011g031020 [Physcia stellaris]
MAALAPILARLGLSQYLERFVTEGFDTWETLLDITESDLRELDVKLGHRRKLQREIAIARGVGTEQNLDSPRTRQGFVDSHMADVERADDSKQGAARAGASGAKRKYRRHPKPDENAPERAPSAYVIFSNKMREDLKPQSLSFTEIAKRVGEQWQLLTPDVKGIFDSQAASAKERYRADLEEYKKTDNYREYNEYLLEFKQKNSDDKRPRLHKEPSATDSQSGPEQAENNNRSSIPHGRQSDQTFAIVVCKPLAFQTTFPSSYSSASASTASPWARRASNNFNPVFANVDKPPSMSVDSQKRQPSVEKTETRATPNQLVNLMQDADMLRARTSSLTMLHRETSQSSNSSPISSAFSSNTNTQPAQSSSLTSMNSGCGATSPADALPSRRLPPLSTIVKASSETGRPQMSHSNNYPSLRRDFGAVTLPPPIAAINTVSTRPASITQSPSEGGNVQASFKGEYESTSMLGQEATFKSDYDTEASPTPIDSDADPLSVLACAGRMVDREERRVRLRRGGKGSGGS